MIFVCVICMVKRPPLSPMETEYRRLLDAVVSPFINTKELEACHSHWLLCTNCKIFMQTLYNFQQKALVGLTNLKYLLNKLNTERTIEDTKPTVDTKFTSSCDVTIKIEPASEEDFIILEAPPFVNLLTEEVVLKLEPEVPQSEHKAEVQDCDFGTMMSGDLNANDESIQHPASTAPSIQQAQVIPKMVATAGSEGKFQVFTHKPKPSKKPCPPKVRRKDGVRKHGEPAPCACDVCGKQCRNQVVLKLHKADHDKKEQNRNFIDIRPPRPELFCQKCAIQFPNPSLYKLHLTSLKHLPRDQCALVRLHCRFECETCKKRFVDEKRRQHHIDVVHLGLRHKCDQCERTYASPSKVRAHVAIAHEKRADLRVPKHICHLCGKTFKVSGPLSSIENFVNQLSAEGVFVKMVNTSGVAFHSKYIADVAPLLRARLEQLIPEPKPRSARWLSTSVPQDQWDSDFARLSDAAYHVNNLVSPVRFAGVLNRIID